MGYNDAMSITMAQKVRSEIRVIDYIEDRFKTLDWYAAELAKRQYNWGFDWLPHDGYRKTTKPGNPPRKSKVILVAKLPTPNISIEDGIKAARMVFRQTVFDETKAARLIECTKRYRRSINEKPCSLGHRFTMSIPNGADGYRYLALVESKWTNEK